MVTFLFHQVQLFNYNMNKITIFLFNNSTSSIKVKVTVKNYLVFLRKNAFEFAMQTSFGSIEVLN